MKQTTKLGLTIYEPTDKFNITSDENSLNHNMELIDNAISNINDSLGADKFKLIAKTNADLTEFGYINKSGNVNAHTTTMVSDYIEAIPDTVINCTNAMALAGSYCVAFYSSTKVFLPDVSLKLSGTDGTFVKYSGEVIVPKEASFFRICTGSKNVTTSGYSYGFSYYTKAEDSVVWNEKNWFAFGTSITDTNYPNEETGSVTGKYVPYLQEMSGLIVHDNGIAGGTIGKGGQHGGSASILNRILTTDISNADLITIEGFVNDFACAVPIGELGDNGGTDAIEDTETITICGALYRAIKYCLENSNATVVLLTESTGQEYTLKNGNTANYRVEKKNSLNLFQQDYNDAIIKMGRFMNGHVIDVGGKSQINCFNPEYLADQIHHSELGGKQYAQTIWDELKYISPKVTTV